MFYECNSLFTIKSESCIEIDREGLEQNSGMLCRQNGGSGTNVIESSVHHHVTMRIAIVSGIHGDLPALEAVVDALPSQRGGDRQSTTVFGAVDVLGNRIVPDVAGLGSSARGP